MIFESLIVAIVFVISVIFLLIAIGIAFVLYIGVSSALFRISWIINFYKKYRPNQIELEKAWLKHINNSSTKLRKDIKDHSKLEAKTLEEWKRDQKNI